VIGYPGQPTATKTTDCSCVSGHFERIVRTAQPAFHFVPAKRLALHLELQIMLMLAQNLHYNCLNYSVTAKIYLELHILCRMQAASN